MSKVLVIGSLNMDMNVKVKKLPKLGETILGTEYYESCGGKGSNQAIAISKLGLKTEMLGMVGKDEYGKILVENLKQYNVVTDNLLISNEKPTGRAIINIDDNGNNNIIVIPGSNFDITISDIDKKVPIIENSDIIVLQNEIPFEVIEYILKISKEKEKIIFYNPAPAKKIDLEILKDIDYLIINETELEEIFGFGIKDKVFVGKIVKLKNEIGIKNIILTLGEIGSVLFDNENNVKRYEAYKIKSIDTTAAGDTFLGAFISKWSDTKDKYEAMKFATAASAITVTRKGAAISIPTKKEVEIFLNNNKK